MHGYSVESTTRYTGVSAFMFVHMNVCVRASACECAEAEEWQQAWVCTRGSGLSHTWVPILKWFK